MTSSFFLKEQTYVIMLMKIIYRCDNDLKIILEDLHHDIKTLLNWFKINSMKPNPKKFQFLPVILNINNIKIKESQKVISLGLTKDNC